MSLHPKAAQLARELGLLMRAYLKDEDGHTALEVAEAFQDGFGTGEDVLADQGYLVVHLPLTSPSAAGEGFDLEAGAVKLEVQPSSLNVWFQEETPMQPRCGFAHLGIECGKLIVEVCDQQARHLARVAVDRD